MRTTLDIDDDVLSAIREIARQRSSSMGKVLSELARKSLALQSETSMRNGFPLLPARQGGEIVTMELVNRLRDEEE